MLEFLNHSGHLFAIRDRDSLEFSLGAARIDVNLRVLEHVLVPLSIRTLYRQQIKFLVVQHEPDRVRDRPS